MNTKTEQSRSLQDVGGPREPRTRCCCKVWTRDTYRYSGRGPTGFTMHYDEHQCKRYTIGGHGMCRQHHAIYQRRHEPASATAKEARGNV